jgi:enoyl-CoA hydratase/carnithine racemase
MNGFVLTYTQGSFFVILTGLVQSLRLIDQRRETRGRTNSHLALGYIKDKLDHALTSGLIDSMDREAENLVREARTIDHKEAVRAFVEKRKPTFSGR